MFGCLQLIYMAVNRGANTQKTKHQEEKNSPQVRLDLYLPTQLVLDVGAVYLRLEKDLQSDDKLGGLFTCEVHVAKLSLAKGTPDFKITECPTSAEKKMVQL